MTIFRYKWERYFAWYFNLAFFAGLLGLGIEFYFGKEAYHLPSAGRTKEIVSHGYEFSVSPPVWWGHQIGLYLFLSLLPAALIYLAVRGFVEGGRP